MLKAKLIGVLLLGALFGATCTSTVAAAIGSDWDMYNGDYGGQRFSSLAQITAANVSKMHLICSREVREGQTFEAGIVVHNGLMYVTTTHDTWAIDAADCRIRWHVRCKPGSYEPFNTNRGVALSDGRVIRGTPSGHLVAYDATKGSLLWDVAPADPNRGEFLSSAPLAWNGLVFIGTAGGDWGVKGRMMAFDIATGRLRWTFATIPTGNEVGARSWQDASSAEKGGGAMWTSYTLDSKRAELFVPVGNPAPDYAGSERPGDNLFTDSVIVLDARTGRLKWWFQLVKHDELDRDLAAPPMLYALKRVRMVALGSKDGHVYSVSRGTHRLLFTSAVTSVANPNGRPSARGTYVCPGYAGGVEWNGPAFDVMHASILVNSVDWCGKYVLHEPPRSIYDRFIDWAARKLYENKPHRRPSFFYEGSFIPDATPKARGWLTCLDALTGRVRWRYHAHSPMVAAVTPTAGGVVFTGDLLGNFLALDVRSGKVLYEANTGGSIAGGVITYSVAGRQYVAVTSGNVSRTGIGLSGSPTVFVLGLGTKPARAPTRLRPPIMSFSKLGGAVGQALYEANCASCHGLSGTGGGVGPSLAHESKKKNFATLTAWIKNPATPMPRLYPDRISKSDVDAIGRYVESL